MMSLPDSFGTLRDLDWGGNVVGKYYSLPALEAAGVGPISRLPISIRIVLESLLRHCEAHRLGDQHVRALAHWTPNGQRTEEIPFLVSRIVLQDFTGVPLLVDLAAMRSAVAALGKDPSLIEPSVPVDLVVDHSVQVDVAGQNDALERNLALEFKRNQERYEFLKWGRQAFETFKVVPPGIGIVHQVNLEYLAKGILEAEGLYYPDTLVGTDSHTTMINGLGVVGWGVGGIEAEAGMLGQPVYFLMPDVVGVHLKNRLKEGVTATDLALTITSLLRAANVVGKFVEFYGPGAAALPVVDRATIANMAPEYGATMGFFPIDDETVKFLRLTGRPEARCQTYEGYYRAQELFGMPREGQLSYSMDLEVDLGSVEPSVAGPRRPQDRIKLPRLKSSFTETFSRPVSEGGFGKSAEALSAVTVKTSTDGSAGVELKHGSVLIAAITSCTNTSNPNVMLAAGLLAKKAVQRGLRVPPGVKTSLAPGSRVVSHYLEKTGLSPYLDQLGFNLVGFGCTTCIGNSGPLAPDIERAIRDHDLVAASVLSGNRNFEARIHPSIKANFLMSPPLVIAFALAGRVDIDLSEEPLGRGSDGRPVFLKEIWPRTEEVAEEIARSLRPEAFQKYYSDLSQRNPRWNEIPSHSGSLYPWDARSTYVQEPPFFDHFALEPGAISPIQGARVLGIFGDTVTTDHISPAGAIKRDSPAGRYLIEKGVQFDAFNSYGSRRGNDRVMTRGTFANVRIKNLMVPGSEGGVTRFQPTGEVLPIYDAAMKYAETAVPLVVIAGREYGTGSSRDWAAKGTQLLGVQTVVAASFERIHRSNLIGMGVLPLQFQAGVNAKALALDGTEIYDVVGLNDRLQPRQGLTVRVTRNDGTSQEFEVTARIDTPVEIEYYRHGGILPYVLRQLIANV